MRLFESRYPTVLVSSERRRACMVGESDPPRPRMASVILPEQYCCSTHSISLLLVSLPTGPPSPSKDIVSESHFSSIALFLAASVKLSMFPVLNASHGWPGADVLRSTWRTLRESSCRFFLFSESTALISLATTLGVNSGDPKKAASRGIASRREDGAIENQ